ncbi:MAG: hypothetical protein QXX38_03460 [Candidatus Aenigmatarchaeota archaeon]
MEYNKAFFRTFENFFLVLKERFGEKVALSVVREVMERNLKEAYDGMEFRFGKPEDFARVVGARDKSLGLKVEFPEVSKNRIVYRFYTDPFPGLKGKVNHKEFDDTYLSFKLRYLLGEDWDYITTQHIWDDAPFTEHIIFKRETS